MATTNRQSRSFATGVALLLSALAIGQTKSPGSSDPGTPPATTRDQTFPLEEVSVFALGQRAAALQFGQYALLQDTKDATVTAYPAFRSEHPLYGEVRFPPGPPGQEGSPAYRFALDESAGTGRGYDRLYFDLNHDGDLTNDKPLAALKDAGERAARDFRDAQQVCFENVTVSLPSQTQETHPLELMPRLMALTDAKLLCFVATKARKGQIQIADRKYDVVLGHGRLIAGGLDNPQATLYAEPAGEGERDGWQQENPLSATRKFNGAFYLFSATPAGDKLTVHPYTGPLGTLEVGPGGRKIDKILFSGALRSATTTVPAGAGLSDDGPPAPARSCKLPVGDYQPVYLSVQMDGLSVMILNNIHADGKPRDKADRQTTYGIALRENKPFVLQFSDKAQVLFALPARDHRVKLGEELSVKAVLIDPALGVMFRVLTHERQLDPKVTIARANGEIVAEGTMPFG